MIEQTIETDTPKPACIFCAGTGRYKRVIQSGDEEAEIDIACPWCTEKVDEQEQEKGRRRL